MKTRTIHNSDGSKILIAGEESVFVPVGNPTPQLKPGIFRKLWVFLFGGFLSALLALPSSAAVVGKDPSLVTTVPTYVSNQRLTLPAAGSKIYAFQNTSATADVVVRKIEIVGASTQTVTGGLSQFLVYVSTKLVHSAAITDAKSYVTANASQPSHILVSSAPHTVQYEGNSAVLTVAQVNAFAGVSPIIRPLIVNNDEAAAANFSDSWSEESPNGVSPLLLPAGASRAIVIEKRQQGSADFSDGSIFIRVFYSVH